MTTTRRIVLSMPRWAQSRPRAVRLKEYLQNLMLFDLLEGDLEGLRRRTQGNESGGLNNAVAEQIVGRISTGDSLRGFHPPAGTPSTHVHHMAPMSELRVNRLLYDTKNPANRVGTGNSQNQTVPNSPVHLMSTRINHDDGLQGYIPRRRRARIKYNPREIADVADPR